MTQSSPLHCRHCQKPLEHVFADLGVSPLCESFLTHDQLFKQEMFYPLCAYVCDACLLVQVQDFESPEAIFREYAYFSSFSSSWLAHARSYVHKMIERFDINQNSFVVEVASNDGYLLTNFVEKNIPVLGIEPARNIAKTANEKGVPTLSEFFGVSLATQLASEGKHADLITANNVLAHVPDINDFVGGFKILLKPNGVATFEIPHLLQLIQQRQFDTIYHEHFSYLSLIAAERIFKSQGLKVFDVEELSSHGGSLRYYVTHEDNNAQTESERLQVVRDKECQAKLNTLAGYSNFQTTVNNVKHELLALLITLKQQNKSIVGYGAPGKGNTLLNYCGIREDLITYTVDRNPYKHGRYLPGTHIPIYHPDKIAETKPDYIVILPWNLKKEIMEQLEFVREWGAQFVVPIPEPRVL